jgi:hypothetical protein
VSRESGFRLNAILRAASVGVELEWAPDGDALYAGVATRTMRDRCYHALIGAGYTVERFEEFALLGGEGFGLRVSR